MSKPANDDVFEGLALHDQLHLDWQPSPLTDGVQIDLANQESARSLQAIAVFEEAPRNLPSDANNDAHELHHLEAKIDVLPSLVAGLAARHALILRDNSIEWTGSAGDGLSSGDTGFVIIYPNPGLPVPLRIPGRIVGMAERAGSRWLLTRFEHVTLPVRDALEKLVFRRHRRQIAMAKGTGVHAESATPADNSAFQTGVFQMPK